MSMGRPHNLKRVDDIATHLKKGLKPKEIAILEGEDRQLIDYYIKTYPQLKKLALQNNKKHLK